MNERTGITKFWHEFQKLVWPFVVLYAIFLTWFARYLSLPKPACACKCTIEAKP